MKTKLGFTSKKQINTFREYVKELEKQKLIVGDPVLKSDSVNAPNHYISGGIETIDYMRAKMTISQFEGYLKGNIIKYVSRYEMKNGVQDLKKAEWYIKRLINFLEGDMESGQAETEAPHEKND